MKQIFQSGLLMICFIMTINLRNLVHGTTSALYPENPNHPNKCKTIKTYSLIQTTCSNMNLRELPQNLKTSIQVLDVTHNRIRNLYNRTFARYPNIAFLYLADNFIIDVEAGAFDTLYYLEALDISINAVTHIPKSIFHMTYLRKLYAAENQITDSSFDGSISAPITYIDLAMNQLTRIPNLGLTADLRYLNVSHNKISKISVDDIAPFCFLKTLDLRNNSIISWEPETCDCQLFLRWVNQYKIDAKFDFKCPNMADCGDVDFSNETVLIRQNCTQIVEMKAWAKKTRSTWILVASCIASFCVCVFIALCCIHKRNKKKRLRLKEEQKMATNMQSAELLHSHNT